MSDKLCVRCGRPVIGKDLVDYKLFEKMHWECFHLEFEHHDIPVGEPCKDPKCPWGVRSNLMKAFKAFSEDSSELSYGETPWDDLDKVSLRKLVIKSYAALSSASNFINVQISGGNVLDNSVAYQVEDTLRKLLGDYQRDDLFRSFYRTAYDLLFPDNPYHPDKWMICDKCGQMAAAPRLKPGVPCSEGINSCGCDGIFRTFTWEDFKGKPPVASEETLVMHELRPDSVIVEDILYLVYSEDQGYLIAQCNSGEWLDTKLVSPVKNVTKFAKLPE